jgi:hypothetical protein
MLLDAAFRPIELWLHMPAFFWNRVALTDELAKKVWRRARADRMKAVAAVRRARERGCPAGMEHVPVEIFERDLATLTEFLKPEQRVSRAST